MTPKQRNQHPSPAEGSSAHGAMEPQARSRRGAANRRRPIGSPPVLQRDLAVYIEGLTAEMRTMAHAADLNSLAYFLEMARLEASIQAQRLARSAGE
ncbi:hypothetical protein [Bosea sp. Root381]|uniref:hypothetical protein n=1 Tax=Bosea sp. Root381 TaxID=1736524 RepID=UPI000A872D2B|nr:hypothetical protein [Bosea sp. Root381]